MTTQGPERIDWKHSIQLCFCCVTDIQEFYELTLLDDTKSVQQKTAETIRIANKWEADNVQREVSTF